MSQYDNSIKGNDNNINDNNTIIGNKNKMVTGDEINNYNIIIPKRISKEDKKKQEKLTKRPCLKDKLGQKITCFGYIVGKHQYLNHLYTIVNIVDTTGEFVADHIQLDFKEDIYDYTYDRGCYIRFTGIVKTYMRNNNTMDYTIDITKKVYMLPDSYELVTEIYDYTKHKINENIIDNYLIAQNITKIHEIINNLRKEINELTNGLFFEDYLYYYVINQYTLNTATYAVYNGEIRDHNLNEDCMIGVLILLGSLLFELKSRDTTLGDILFDISTECNVLQGIDKYTTYEDNPKLKVFYQLNLSENHLPVGKKKLELAFQFIVNRYYNFRVEEPYDKNKLDLNVIKQRAYHMIQQYISK